MVKLRLARAGGKKAPYYHVVAADSHKPRDGRFIEVVGSYDPGYKPERVTWKADLVKHWLDVGAQPTLTVSQLLKRHKPGADAPQA